MYRARTWVILVFFSKRINVVRNADYPLCALQHSALQHSIVKQAELHSLQTNDPRRLRLHALAFPFVCDCFKQKAVTSTDSASSAALTALACRCPTRYEPQRRNEPKWHILSISARSRLRPSLSNAQGTEQ